MANHNMADIIAADAAVSGPTDNIDKLVAEFIEADASVKEMEEGVRFAKERRTKLQLELIPLAMQEARKKRIDYGDGAVLSLRPFIAADLPSASKINEADEDEKEELATRRAAALGWLRENQGGPIIKNMLMIEVPKGKDNVVAELAAKCEELELSWSRAETVHHQTLLSFLREKVKLGAQIPVDTFKLMVGQKAHYKPGKGE